MTLYKCLSCNGVYDPDQEGGYYHRCPDGVKDPRNENVKSAKSSEVRSEGRGRRKVDGL